jgi:CheY-like chemotaxis protein
MTIKTYNVLIIEDDLDDVLLMTRALNTVSKSTAMKIEIIHRRNGLEALSTMALADLTSRLPAIVVVDLNMPIMSGEQFLTQLRKELCLDDLPAVVLTTATEKPIHEAAIAAGADQVFVKPNSLTELVSIARTIVDIGTARQAVAR